MKKTVLYFLCAGVSSVEIWTRVPDQSKGSPAAGTCQEDVPRFAEQGALAEICLDVNREFPAESRIVGGASWH
jgi:hypothetical protein